MKYLSVCSGIEAASVAFKPLGWEPLAFSEIEAFPRAVLQHHYPDTPLHGDFTELHSQPWIVDADLLCGGTPCQSFSVAGLRKSMGDDRGNLTLQFIKLADAIDDLRRADGREPAFILWENVPGIFSTHDNAFGAFLGGLCGRDAAIPEPADGWPSAGVVDGPTRVAAWRVLDAQHFGLAQRRKRVFVLAKGGAGKWAAADALLPIIESSSWHPAPSRSKGEGVTGTVDESIVGCLQARDSKGVGSQYVNEGKVVPMAPAISSCITTKYGKQVGQDMGADGRLVPVVMATGQASAMSAPTIDMAPTLSCNHEAPILMRMREGKEGGGKGPLVSKDQSLTLATGNDQVLALAPTLTASNDPSRSPQSSEVTQQVAAVYSSTMQVRRLTPVECARLQGFPDDYLDITYRGKPAADGNKYKALGNSWAVPVVRWIGKQIDQVRNARLNG